MADVRNKTARAELLTCAHVCLSIRKAKLYTTYIDDKEAGIAIHSQSSEFPAGRSVGRRNEADRTEQVYISNQAATTAIFSLGFTIPSVRPFYEACFIVARCLATAGFIMK